uniref:Secreted protein n=1 Tax=Oryza meridionalis TaxID=40149 RepID=A0A0E0CKP9_9ORYZ
MALLMLRAALSPAIVLSTIDGVVSISVSVAAAASDHDRVGAAKRARDGHLLPRSEEHDADADACGWSSAVMERNLALRRRRGGASSPCCSSSFRPAATVAVVQEQGFPTSAAAARDVM